MVWGNKVAGKDVVTAVLLSLWHCRSCPLRRGQPLLHSEEAEGGAQCLYKLYVSFRLFQQPQQAVSVFVSWQICYSDWVFCCCRHLVRHGEPTSQGKTIAALCFAVTQHLLLGPPRSSSREQTPSTCICREKVCCWGDVAETFQILQIYHLPLYCTRTNT